MARFLAFWLLLAGVGCGSVPRGEPGPLLEEGRQLYEAGDYRKATRYFKAVKSRHPESEEREEATYLTGESQRLLRNPQRAFAAYQEFVERYPNSRFSVAAARGEYELGSGLLDGDVPGFFIFKTDPSYGVRILEHMQVHFKNHSLADDALMRLADFHLAEDDYEDAEDVLGRLLAQYPRSQYGLRARFQLARAFWLQSEGPDYDERILERSRRAFEDFIGTVRLRKQEDSFAEQIQAAEEMIKTVNGRLAQKHYRIGRFYERTDHPESAVFHYEHCARTFAGTEYADRSSERLKSLKKELAPAGAAAGRKAAPKKEAG